MTVSIVRHFDPPAAQPYQRAQPRRQAVQFEHRAGRERVEVAGEEMKALLVRGDRAQQRAELEDAPAFGPCCITALRWTPKIRTSTVAGTTSMNACREKRGRCH